MRYFKIPFVVEEEEKVFGGYISIRQAIYLFLSLIGIRTFWFPIALVIRILLFVLFAGFMVSLAFLKINNMYLDTYLIVLLKYLIRKKKYTYGEDR